MRSLYLKHLFFILFFSFSLNSTFADDKNLFSGVPDIVKNLNEKSLVPMTAQRLANADIGWINLDLLRELGFDISPKNIEKLKRQILDNYAFVVADESVPKNLFTKEEKTFYADRYGGSGTGAFGSGRAAAAGIFQIKGIGRTPLVEEPYDYGEESGLLWNLKNPVKAIKRKLSDRHHSHGAATLREAITEAVWGEILNKELPYGSNRIVAVITTKLKVGAEPRALIIRENSLRPAHFMKNVMSIERDEEKEVKRIEVLNKKIENALPTPDSSEVDLRKNAFRSQILEFTNRMGRTFGTEYAHSVYHGSTSPSNIEINGRAIDHGPMTALDGFSRIMFADDNPNGSLGDYKKYILFEFAKELRTTAPKDLQKYVPTDEELGAQLKFSYNDQINREFLWRTGVPDQFIDSLMSTDSALEYTKLLKTIALAGNNEKLNSRYNVPRNTGEYSVPDIINTLTNGNYQDEYSLRQILVKEIPDEILRTKFSRAYYNLISDVVAHGIKNGINPGAIAQYLSEASSLRNKKLEGLFRGPKLWTEQYAKVLKYKYSEDSSTISEYINKTIEINSRNYLNSPDFVLVLSEPFKSAEGTLQLVYDAKRGQRELLYSVKSSDKNINIELVLENRKIVSNEIAYQEGDLLFFRLPYIEDISNTVQDVKIKTNKSSYKTGNSNCVRALTYITKI